MCIKNSRIRITVFLSFLSLLTFFTTVHADIGLYVSSFIVPPTGISGSTIDVIDTTNKNGSELLITTQTSYYLSVNSWLDPWDIALGSRTVPALASGAQISTDSTTLTIPAGVTTGSYYVLAVADSQDVVIEKNESNNKKSAAISIEDATTTYANIGFYISSLTVPNSGVAGSIINVTDTTNKTGSELLITTQTSYYLSVDSRLDSRDIALGSRTVPAFESGAQSSSGNATLTIPASTDPGDYYIIAKADSSNVVTESNEGNNNRSSSIIKFYRAPEYVSKFGRGSLKTDGELNFPSGIATDDINGYVYTCSQLFNQISKFDSNGNFITKWSSLGCLGMDVDTAGNIYVASIGQHAVTKYNPDGVQLAKWGALGTADGQFNKPRYVAINHALGLVYVSDSKNYRVQVFDTNGVFQRKWGSFSWSEADKFAGSGSFGIAVDQSNGDVYVTNPSTSKIKKFDMDGNFLFQWGMPGKLVGEIRWPRGIDVDQFGVVYVADADNERISKFDSNGNSLGVFQGLHSIQDGPFHPRDVAVNHQNDFVYAAAAYAHRVDKFDLAGTYQTTWGWLDNEGAVFNQPKGLVIDTNSNLYVADSENFLVKKFMQDGQHLHTLGHSSRVSAIEDGADGAFDFVTSIATDDTNFLYVLRAGIYYPGDTVYKRVQIFDENGIFQNSWNYSGFVGSMQGIMFNAFNGFIYVSNTPNNKIQVFDKVGAFQFEFGGKGTLEGKFNSPSKLTSDPRNGNVFIVDVNNQRIQKFSNNGEFLTSWGLNGSGIGQFKLFTYSGLAVDSLGNVYVADTGNDRVQVFSENGDYILSFGWNGGGNGGFLRPSGIVVDSNDNINVLDTTVKRVQAFSAITK